MRQSRTTSLIKAMSNVGVGYGLAVVLQLVLFPALGLHPTLAQSVHFGLAFTVLSVIRSYALRRLFERLRTLGRGGTEAEKDAAALQDPIELHPAIALALGGQQAARIDGALHDRVRLDPGDLPPVVPRSSRESCLLIVVGFGVGKRAGCVAVRLLKRPGRGELAGKLNAACPWDHSAPEKGELGVRVICVTEPDKGAPQIAPRLRGNTGSVN